MDETRRYGAGDRLEDLCRVCKEPRRHTVIVSDGKGLPLRVVCDFCGSQHNYRGGAPSGSAGRSPGAASSAPPRPGREPFPVAGERERRYEPMSIQLPQGTVADLELLLRRIVREEAGVSAVVPADRWRGGQVILRAGKEGVQDKVLPIEGLFHKIVMIRNKLRVLEQQVNSSEIPEDLKLKLQSYITGCYGSLTTFNILFADEEDKFKGSGGEE